MIVAFRLRTASIQSRIMPASPAAVTGSFVILRIDRIRIVNRLFAGREIGQRERFHIADDIAARSHDAGTTPHVRGKSLDRKVYRHAACELHAGHVMIRLIVATTVNATAVIGRTQVTENRFAAFGLLSGRSNTYSQVRSR